MTKAWGYGTWHVKSYQIGHFVQTLFPDIYYEPSKIFPRTLLRRTKIFPRTKGITMEQFFSPYQTLYHTNLYLSNLHIWCYNEDMSPRHFANMYNQKSHRHDQPSDGETFNEDFGAICGMLYSVITLKAFFPKSPEKRRDAEYTQLTLF